MKDSIMFGSKRRDVVKAAFLAAVAVLIAAASSAASSAGLSRETFRNPPQEAKPHTWWHWMNGNVTKEGITADLEAMARVGIGGAQIFDAGLALPKGPVAFASDAWFDCLVHADREAKRLGIELCIANCSGWTSSAGPWITPELSMKYVVDTTVRVKGGERFDGRLPLPKKTNGFYEDIAVLAFPEPSAAKAALRDLPDFDMQVFRGRGNFRMGAGEGGPQMPLRITNELAPPEACVASREIIDLTSQMRSDGSLAWEAPKSHAAWIVLRVGYMANGRTNRSASKAGLGLECDKLDPHALDVHFDAYVGRLLKRLPKDRALKGVLLDSYEVFGQNWTRGFERSFAEMAGYPITNFLPVLAGYPVDGAARTETFLRDFRRVISTLFSMETVRSTTLSSRASVTCRCPSSGVRVRRTAISRRCRGRRTVRTWNAAGATRRSAIRRPSRPRRMSGGGASWARRLSRPIPTAVRDGGWRPRSR